MKAYGTLPPLLRSRERGRRTFPGISCRWENLDAFPQGEGYSFENEGVKLCGLPLRFYVLVGSTSSCYPSDVRQGQESLPMPVKNLYIADDYSSVFSSYYQAITHQHTRDSSLDTANPFT